MIVRVEFPINLRALHPEIGAQIDHLATELKQRHCKFRRDAVGQGQKNDLCLAREQVRPGIAKAQFASLWIMRKSRKNLCQGLPGVLAGCDGGQLDMRMGQQQPDKFLARIAAGANYANTFFCHIQWFIIDAPVVTGSEL
jgi:hypothetical protein